jgi:hypothetical protein
MRLTRNILRALICEEITSVQHVKAQSDANKAIKKALKTGKPIVDLVTQGKVDIALDDGTKVSLSTDVSPLQRVKQGDTSQILSDLEDKNLNITVKKRIGKVWTATGRLTKVGNPGERGLSLKLSKRW